MRALSSTRAMACAATALVIATGGAAAEKNPGPGDPFPRDLVWDVAGGGTFRPADFRGAKAVLITSHLVDDGPVSWLPDPFKRLKELQAAYKDDLVVAVMPEYAHLRKQDRKLWKTISRILRDLQDPGDVKILIESTGTGAKFGLGDFSLYKALNPEGIKGWWVAVLIDKQGNIAWSSYQPYTRNTEHVLYETSLRAAVVKLLDPAGFAKWLGRLPTDWVKQKSPWGTLEIEDFERYGDLGDRLIAEAPRIKAVTGIRFEGVQTGFVDDFLMVPKLVSPGELDKVVAWVDAHALDRPHVTPLEREREIARLAAKAKGYPKALRVNWGSDKDYRDPQGNLWRAQQPWLRGTFGYMDGDDYVYPAGEKIAGSDEAVYRTARYCFNRLRFTVPNGVYTLRVHAAQPFGGPHPKLRHTNHGSAMHGWPGKSQIEIHPDTPRKEVWTVPTPPRRAVVHEKKGIRVTDRLLDLRFNFHWLPQVAATELIQESADPGEAEGIPDWPSATGPEGNMPRAAPATAQSSAEQRRRP